MMKSHKSIIINNINLIMKDIGWTLLSTISLSSIWYDFDENTSFVKDREDNIHRIEEMPFIKVSAILTDLKKDF